MNQQINSALYKQAKHCLFWWLKPRNFQNPHNLNNWTLSQVLIHFYLYQKAVRITKHLAVEKVY